LTKNQKKKIKKKAKKVAASTSETATVKADGVAVCAEKEDGDEKKGNEPENKRRVSKRERRKLVMDADLSCKLVDFRNACWTYKQFTSDIQTR